MSGGTSRRQAASTVVRQAEPAEVEAMIALLAETFMQEEMTCWLFPDEEDRRRQPIPYQQLLQATISEGGVLTTGDDAGISVWQRIGAGQGPISGQEQPDESQIAAMQELYGESLPRVMALGQMVAERHPHDAPHLYLVCMGVLPERRGAGIGAAMLGHKLAEADAEGAAAYLEASSPRSRALYQRHGFEPIGDPIELPDGPSLYPMWREPAG